MALTAKQVTQVKIGAYINNGGYRAFEMYPVDIEAWNVDAVAQQEFMGSETTQALSGFEYSNFLGYRPIVSLDLNNSTPTQTANLQVLFSLFSAQYNRTFWTTTANGAGAASTSLVLQSDAPTTNDYFNGLLVSGLTGGDVLITDYDGATRTATLAAARSWSSGAGVSIIAQPNFQTVVGLALDTTASNILYYNVIGSAIGIMRDLTIGRQRIELSLRGIDRVQTVPNSFTIA